MNIGKVEISKNENNINSSELDLLSMKMLSVFEIIRWLKGSASFDQIVSLAALKQIKENEIAPLIEILQKKKFIKKKEGLYIALTDAIFTEAPEENSQLKMYQMFSNYRKNHIRRNH